MEVELLKKAVKTTLLYTILLERLFGYYAGVTFDYCPNCGVISYKTSSKVDGLVTPTGVAIGFAENTKCPLCKGQIEQKTFYLEDVEKAIDEIVDSIDVSSISDFDDFLDVLDIAFSKLFKNLES